MNIAVIEAYESAKAELNKLEKKRGTLQGTLMMSGDRLSNMKAGLDSLLYRIYVDGDEKAKDELQVAQTEITALQTFKDRSVSVMNLLDNNINKARTVVGNFQAEMDRLKRSGDYWNVIYDASVIRLEHATFANFEAAANRLRQAANQEGVNKAAEADMLITEARKRVFG